MKRMTAKVDIAPVTDCPVSGFSTLFRASERASTRRHSANRQNRESYHDIVSTIFEHNTEVMEESLIKNAKAGDLAQIALILQRRAEVLFNIDAKDPATGSTALMLAASNGHSKIVQLLLRHGADVTVRNNDGVSAIELTSPLVRQMLLESVEQGGAHNAFCQAAWQGNAALLKKLLAQHAVSVNCQNSDHLSPILLATRDIQLFEKLGSFASGANYSPVEVIRELLNHGADLTVADDSQMTALHYICCGGSPLSRPIALCLLHAGADPDARDRRNATPLHYASQKGNADVVVALLECGADPNAKDLSGTTPLHLTARHGHDQATTVLVQHGADIFVANEDGLSPLDVAKNKAIKLTLRQAWLSSSNKTKGNADTHAETNCAEKGVEHGTSVTSGGGVTQSKDAVPHCPSSDSGSVIANGVGSGTANYSRHVKGNLVTFHPSQVKPNSDKPRQLTRGQTRFGGKGMACHPTPRSPKSQRSGQGRVTFTDAEDAVQNKKTAESQTARYEYMNFLPHLSQNSPSPALPSDQDGSRRRNSDDKPLAFEDLFPDAPDEPKTLNNKDSKPGSARFPKPGSCPTISQMAGAMNSSPRNSDTPSFSPKPLPHLASIFFTDFDRVYRNVCQKEDSGLKLLEVDGNSSEDRCISTAAKSSVSPLHSKPFKSILRDGDFNIDDTRVRKSDDSGCPDDGVAHSNSVSSSSSTSNVSTSLDIQDLASGGQKNSLSKDTSKTLGTSREEGNLNRNSNVSCSTELHRSTTTDTGIKVTRIRSDASNGATSFSSSPIVKRKIDFVKTEDACQNQAQNNSKTTVVLVKPPPSNSSVKLNLASQKITSSESGAGSGAKNASVDKVTLKVSGLANEDALPVAPPRRIGSFREKIQIASSKSCDAVKYVGQSEADSWNATQCQTNDSARTKATDAKTQVVNLKRQDQNAVLVVSAGGSASTGNFAFHRSGHSASCGPGNRGTAACSVESDSTKKTTQQSTTALKQNRCDKKINSTVSVIGKLEGSSPSPGREQETRTVPGKTAKSSVKESEVRADSSVRRVFFSPAVTTTDSSQAKSTRTVSVDLTSSCDNSSSPPDNFEALIPRRSASFRHGTSRDANRPGHGCSEAFVQKDLHAELGAKTGNAVLPKPVIPDKQSLHSRASIPKSNEIPVPPQSHHKTHHRVPGNHSTYHQPSTSENQPSSQKPSTSEHKSSAQKITTSSESQSSSSSQRSSAVENLVPFNKPFSHTSVQRSFRSHLRTTATETRASSNPAAIGADKNSFHSGESLQVSSSHQKVNSVSTTGEGCQKPPGQSKAAIIIKHIRSKLGSAEQQVFTAQKIGDSSSKDKHVDVEPIGNVKAVASSRSKCIPKEDACTSRDASSRKSMSSPFIVQMGDNMNKQESISVLPEEKNRRSVSIPNELPAPLNTTGQSQNGSTDLEERSGPSDQTKDASNPVTLSVSVLTARHAQVIHTGPVICDPFESLKQRQESAMAAAKVNVSDTPDNPRPLPTPKSAKQRAQIVSSAKSRQEVRPKKTRQPSVSSSASASRTKFKCKSGRRERNRRKSKRNCAEPNAETSSREEELANGPDVKLIGGIGWHVAARPSDARTREEDREAVVLLHDSGDYDSSETVQSSSRSTGRSLGGESLHSEGLDQSTSRERDKWSGVSLLEAVPALQHVRSSSPKKVSGRKGVAITGVEKLTGSKSEQKTDRSAFSECDVTDQLSERLIPDAVLLPKETGIRSGRGRSGLQVVTQSEPVGNVALLKRVEEAEEEVTVRVLPASPRDDRPAQPSVVDNQQKKDGEPSPATECDRIGASAATEYAANVEELIRKILDAAPNPSLGSSARRKWKAKQKEKEDSIQSSENQDTVVSGRHTLTHSLSDTLKSEGLWSDSSFREGFAFKQQEMQSGSNPLYESLVSGKPPMAARSSVTSSVADPSFQALERSPRFVRKHDSVTLLPRATHASSSEDEYSQTKVMEAVISNLQQLDDSLLSTDQNAKLVTSRLGRSCTQSRTGSAHSSAPSGGGDDVETIQWKRGNMLGKGAYGTVWCGLTNSGELIAVKMIELNTSNLEKAETEYEQIQEEVELLKTLKHKHIVGYLGTSLEDNFVSIFMHFIPGGSIASIIARFGSLEEEVFCNYTKQILEGVEYLHANNVIHRDIKGGNIMVMHNGIIKLIDFGCAKKLCLNITSLSADQSPLLKSMRGTPYWMAPEVVREDGHGIQSDIWSIGCTVFEMATKKPPWSDYPPAVAIFTIGCDSKPIPQLPSKFSANAHNFVNACLTRDPSKRPSATQLLHHAFIINRKRPKTSSLS